MSLDNGEMFRAMTELLPVMQKYSEMHPTFVNIKVEKYKEGTIIKIKSDDKLVGESLAEIMTAISKMSVDAKVTCVIEDHS